MHDAVIVGAGISGLCAAFHLRLRGCRRLAVLDQSAAGHDRGSSHGRSRITRSSYHDPRYVALARRAHRDGWPLLERHLGTRLVHRTPGLFFGPANGPFAAFLTATLSAGVAVEAIEVATARAAFPLLALHDADAVLRDDTAGVLAAADTMAGLRAWLQQHDVAMRQDTKVTALQPEDGHVGVVTGTEVLRTRRVVVATGAWTGRLVPTLAGPLRVLRQQVAYVDVAAEAAACAVGTFPVWARIGMGDEFDYGLPVFQRPGLKVARHRTTGAADDPDATGTIDHPELLALARRRLRAEVTGLAGTETCLYTVAPGEELAVQPLAADARIVVMTTCSGHAFKFAPVLGADAAALLAG